MTIIEQLQEDGGTLIITFDGMRFKALLRMTYPGGVGFGHTIEEAVLDLWEEARRES